jgi:hypothetical protein
MTGIFKTCVVCALLLVRVIVGGVVASPSDNSTSPGSQKLNNLAAVLLNVVPAPSAESFPFVRPGDGWIFTSHDMPAIIPLHSGQTGIKVPVRT